jgi:hypothetical protein
MDDFKKYGCHPIITIFWMATEVFQSLEKRGMPHVFENLLTIKRFWSPPCGDKGRLNFFSHHKDG